jgi:hypothetical protein
VYLKNGVEYVVQLKENHVPTKKKEFAWDRNMEEGGGQTLSVMMLWRMTPRLASAYNQQEAMIGVINEKTPIGV